MWQLPLDGTNVRIVRDMYHNRVTCSKFWYRKDGWLSGEGKPTSAISVRSIYISMVINKLTYVVREDIPWTAMFRKTCQMFTHIESVGLCTVRRNQFEILVEGKFVIDSQSNNQCINYLQRQFHLHPSTHNAMYWHVHSFPSKVVDSSDVRKDRKISPAVASAPKPI